MKCRPWKDLLEIAAGRTSLWRVWKQRKTSANHPVLVEASSEKDALRKGGRMAYHARPILNTREWTAVFAEHGRPCLGARRRRR